MNTWLSVLGLFLALTFNLSHAQIDANFCDVSNIVSDDGQNIPIPYRNESEVYSVLVEQNEQVSNAKGIEITELYDGKQNLGVEIKRTLNTNILTYTFVNEDEFLFISPDGTCRVLKQEDALTLGNFQVVLDKNGKKHIASPLTLISANVDIPRAYLGSRNRFVRGIAVREWQACVYSETKEATLRLTYSYSNPEKWLTPYHNLPGQESIPVQIRIDHKPTSAAKPTYTEYYNILEFKTQNLVDPALFAIPSGVYCPGRFTKKNWPELPQRFTFVSHLTSDFTVPDSNMLVGFYLPSHFEYDRRNKLARIDIYNPKGQLESAIEDFATGLTYEINDFLLTCNIKFFPVEQPNDIFRLEEEPAPEYLGLHYVRGISTRAWIAPRNITNNGTTEEVLMEWHFMTESWAQLETTGLVKQEPAAVYIHRTRNGVRVRDEQQVAAFDSTHRDYFDYDVSICDVPRIHVFFKITDREKFGTIRANYRAFREAAYRAVRDTSTLRVIRLARFEVLLEKDDSGTVLVEFTIMEKSLIGNQLVEVTAEEAYAKLEKAVDEGLVIQFTNSNNGQTAVMVDQGSLKKIADRTQRFVKVVVDSKTTVGTSGGIVALLVILFLIVGLAGGLLIGVFVVIKRSITITLPGPLSYFNPNFSGPESA